MKKIITGFIICSLITVGVFAATYIAETATFKIYVNGVDKTADLSPVVINGSTYLPLKAIGNALGVPVTWNSAESRVEVGAATSTPSTSSDTGAVTPIQSDVQYSINNPAPIGTIQTTSYNSLLSGEFRASVVILDVVRGDKATKMIKEANQFNPDPPAGMDYVVAHLRVSIDSVTDETKAININSALFDVFDSDNTEVQQDTYAVPPSPDLRGDVYKGGTLEGNLVFTVKSTDTAPKVSFLRNYDGTGGVWLSLTK